MKHRKHRWLAGTLAFLLSCSALIPSGNAVFAASKGRVAESETNVIKEEKGDENEKQTTAETLTIEQGESFEIEKDFTGLALKKGEKAVFMDVVSEDGQGFFADRPGTYLATYLVTPEKGACYELTRKIVVRPREPENKRADRNQKSSKGDTEESDPDPEPVLTEAPEVPENAENLKLDVSAENASFLSVVPETMTENRSVNVNLVVGERLPYPSNLGNYSTTYFTVNGHVAYCLESAKSSPPSSDYVANIFESNLALQKVLYYGYGGPGDITGSYMPSFDWKLKYIFTHIAASYAYCGTDGFYGCTFESVKASGLWDYIQYLNGLEAPPKAAIDLTPTSTKAYESNGVQRTEEFRLQGDHRNYITLNLPENVTYHSGGSTKNGNVKIPGGTNFYFSAPMTVTGTWNSGSLAGKMGTQWKTLVVSTGGSTQDIGYGTFFEEESDSVSFEVKWMDYAKVKVMKKDNVTNVNLAGAVFGIYSDKECTKLITEMPATNEKGETQVEIPKTQETVYLKEISVPNGYKLNTEAFNVKLQAGKTQSLTISNEEQKGKITIRKSGEVLSSVSGQEGNLKFEYQSVPFGEASYSIYAAEKIVSQDQKTPIYESGELIDQLTTKADGSITSKELHLGKYKIVEQKAPADLTIGKTEAERTQYVTLSYAGQTVELVQEETTYINDRPKVKVQAVKKSENDKETLEGAVFGLYAGEDIINAEGKVVVKKDTLIEKVTSDKEGAAAFHSDIPINFRYYLKEIQAPESYYMSSDRYDFLFEYENDKTYTYEFSHTFSNKEVRGEIHVFKIDKDAEEYISQGDADLDGAVYGLYAAEDIKHPNGKSEDVHKKDDLVAQGVIKDGKVDFTNLYLGNYYVKEISPGEGYLLDETAYPVEVGYEGQDVAIVHRNVTVKETVKKQAFELIKISEDGNQTETELLKGAGFKVFLIQNLKGVKDGSLKPSEGNAFKAEDFIGYDYSEDETAHYYENGKKVSVEELFTDKKGFVRSPELPYGKYVVFESTTPKNLQTINPFLVTITEDSREPQPWRVFDDRPIQFFLKIIKEDAQTHLLVLNNHAQYKIYDVKKKEYVTMKVRYPEEKELDVFETNDEGYLMTPEQLKMGTYRIEEVKAPDLYVQPGYEMALKDGESNIPLNQLSQTGAYEDAKRDFITITVNSETAYEVEEETGKYIVVVRQQNDEAVGSLTIKKTGEDLVGAKNVEDSLLTKMKNGIAGTINSISEFFGKEEVIEEDSGYMFQYEKKGAEGITFEVYAKETIYTPDGQKDEAGNRKVLYEKDGLVAKLVTGKEGTVSLHNLPVGSYYLKETDVGNHHFVLDPEAKEFEIKYQGQEVAVDYVSMELENKRQKIEKARENTIKQLHEKTFVPFEYTAREFFDYWLYYYMIDEADIAYNTYTAYRNIIYNYFLVVWGDKKITAIQRDDLIAALDSIPYDSILRSAYGVIGGSFQYALENHIIYLNPVKSAIKVKRKTEKKCEIENNKKAEHVDQPPVLPAVYTLQQVTIMLYLCKQEEPKIFIALLLALTAGLRISEIIAIKYEDIDFGNHEIYIERQLGRSTKNEGLEDGKLLTQELRTKTRNSVRGTPLADFVIDEIILQRQKYEELRANIPDFHDYGYLCCQDDGKPYHRGFAQKAYTRLMEKCGFTKIPWRKLRNTYATILAEFEISMKAIAASLGHYSADFTQEIYVNTERVVYNADCEIIAFALEVLPKNNAAQLIPLDERYLLEVLP